MAGTTVILTWEMKSLKKIFWNFPKVLQQDGGSNIAESNQMMGPPTLQKGTATHSNIPAWRIPWTEEAGGLQSVGSKRVGHDHVRASLVTQVVRNLPAMRETQVRSLGLEDPLEKGMATHSSILARRILRTEEPGRLSFLGSQRVRHTFFPTLNN